MVTSDNLIHVPLQPGVVFAERFKIIKLLGSGALGVVYRARDMRDSSDIDGAVALKVLRSGEAAGTITDEVNNLNKLAQAEQQLADGVSSVPCLIASLDRGSHPFLAMEFIRGRRIQDLIEEQFPDPLGEPLALNVATQLYRLLGILHRKLNKTYTDLKFENLWWCANPKGPPGAGLLKVTDWNVLGEREAPGKTGIYPGVQKDLFNANLYLYYMLTGTYPQIGSGFKVGYLHTARYWERISYGTQQFLFRAISRQQFTSAGRLRVQTKRLLGYWQSEIDDLVRDANLRHTQAQKWLEHGRESYYDYCMVRAREIIDIAKNKADQAGMKDARLDFLAVNLARDDTRNCLDLFIGGSLDLALRQITRAIPRVTPAHNLVWFREIVQLTKDMQVPVQKENDAAKAFQSVLEGNYAQAHESIIKWKSGIGNLPHQFQERYEKILNTVHVQCLVQKASRASGQVATQSYADALITISDIPVEMLPDGFGSNLKLEAENSRVGNEVEGYLQVGEKAFAQGNSRTAIESWYKGFTLDPDNGKIFDAVVSAAEKLIADPNSSQRDILDLINVPMAFRQESRLIRIETALREKRFKESQSNSPDLAGLAGNLTVPMPLPAKQPDVHDVILSGQKYLEKKDVFQAAMEWRSGLADFPQDAQLHQSILAAIDKLLDDSLFSDANIIIRAINSGQQAGLPQKFQEELARREKLSNPPPMTAELKPEGKIDSSALEPDTSFDAAFPSLKNHLEPSPGKGYFIPDKPASKQAPVPAPQQKIVPPFSEQIIPSSAPQQTIKPSGISDKTPIDQAPAPVRPETKIESTAPKQPALPGAYLQARTMPPAPRPEKTLGTAEKTAVDQPPLPVQPGNQAESPVPMQPMSSATDLQTRPIDYRSNLLGKLLDIFNKINKKKQNKELTIDEFEKGLREVDEIMKSAPVSPPAKEGKENYEQDLKRAKELRENMRMDSVPFGKKTEFYNELCRLGIKLNETGATARIIEDIMKFNAAIDALLPDRALQKLEPIDPLTSIKNLERYYGSDPLILQKEKLAIEVVQREAKNKINDPEPWYYGLENLARDYPQDRELERLTEDVRQAALDKYKDKRRLSLDDWDGERRNLDYYQAFSKVNPVTCKNKIEKLLGSESELGHVAYFRLLRLDGELRKVYANVAVIFKGSRVTYEFSQKLSEICWQNSNVKEYRRRLTEDWDKLRRSLIGFADGIQGISKNYPNDLIDNLFIYDSNCKLQKGTRKVLWDGVTFYCNLTIDDYVEAYKTYLERKNT